MVGSLEQMLRLELTKFAVVGKLQSLFLRLKGSAGQHRPKDLFGNLRIGKKVDAII